MRISAYVAPSFFAEAKAASARSRSSVAPCAPKSVAGGRTDVAAPSAIMDCTKRRRSIMGESSIESLRAAEAVPPQPIADFCRATRRWYERRDERGRGIEKRPEAFSLEP